MIFHNAIVMLVVEGRRDPAGQQAGEQHQDCRGQAVLQGKLSILSWLEGSN